jgi:two-component system nitrate/nitrite sensor histidine kinase NarX
MNAGVLVPDALASTGAAYSYCLPLLHGNEPIALLHFTLAAAAPLTVEQRRLFNNLIPAMTLAIEAARPHRSAFIKAEATEAERRRVAQELHDSLAQNIAYLRLKLDQLSGEDALSEITAVQRQLEQMRDVAEQAYQEVRGTLVKLRTENTPGPQTGLQVALPDLVNVFRERTSLQVHLSSAGQPAALLPDQERQALYILREALINVEKHAAASAVKIHLQWSADILLITLEDNGRGFEPALSQRGRDGHFGMDIMHERARALGADLALTSAPGQGTRLALSIPLSTAVAAPTHKKVGVGI